MSIVIKEIILSDNLEKFVEKVNFNFDQLMLAGGGPPGPQGPQGLVGPAGPAGQRGTDWFVGCTGTTIAIGASLIDGDLFLATGCTTTWTKGDVYEWNEIGATFEYTGLNLVGPTGATGSPGANLGWSTFEGGTSVNRWAIKTAAGAPGPSGNFVLMKGDTTAISGAGISDGYSRDILWLGGQKGAESGLNQWPIDRHPKIFISPREDSVIDVSSYEDVTTGGEAGGGIGLGNEPDGPSDQWLNSNSFSNIFIDSDFNLRMVNFTDFKVANTPVTGTSTNNISIESMNRIVLLAKGYGNASNPNSGSIEFGPGSTYNYMTDVSGKDSNIVLSTFNYTGTPATIRLENNINAGSQTIISGGQGEPGGAPNAVFTNVTTPSGIGDDSVFKISIRPASDTKVSSGSDMEDDFLEESGNIYGGLHRTGPSDYESFIAIGTGNSKGLSLDWNFASYKNAILISSDSFTSLNTWASFHPYGLSVKDQIRMEGTAPVGATGYFMVNEDPDGTAIWTEPNRHIRDHFVSGVTADQYAISYFNGTTSIRSAVGASGVGPGTLTYSLEWFGPTTVDPETGPGLRYIDGRNIGGPGPGLRGKVLTSSDDWGNAVWGESGATYTLYTSNGTWNAASRIFAGLKYITIIAIGGGGGGGGGAQFSLGFTTDDDCQGGAGGQGGGLSIVTIPSSELFSVNYDVEVGIGGKGGTGGADPVNNGSDGVTGGISKVIYSLTTEELIRAAGGEGGQGGYNYDFSAGGRHDWAQGGGARRSNQNTLGYGTENPKNTMISNENYPTSIPAVSYSTVAYTQNNTRMVRENFGGGFNLLNTIGYKTGGGPAGGLTYDGGNNTSKVPSGGGAGSGVARITEAGAASIFQAVYYAGKGGDVEGGFLSGGVAGTSGFSIGGPGGNGEDGANLVGSGGGGGASPTSTLAASGAGSGGDGGLYGGGGGGGSARTIGFAGGSGIDRAGGGGDGGDGCVLIIEHY